MPLKTTQDEMPAINLTPMIDIVFQLIIFFMVGARFTEMEKKMDLKVPSVKSTEALANTPERYIVDVHRDGHMSLNRTDVSADALTAQLTAAREQHGNILVTVRGDGEGAFQNIAVALAACREAGVEVGISVRLAKKGK